MSAWGVAALAGIQVPEHWTLALGTWHLAAWRGSFHFESWVLITVNSQGGIWKGREEVASLRPKGKEFLRKEGRGRVVEAQYKRWWSAEIRNVEDGEDGICQTLDHEDDLKIFLQGRVDGLLDDKYRALSSKEQGAAETHSCHFQLDRHIFFSHRHQQHQLFIHRSDIKKFLSRWNEACQRMLRWNPVGTEWSTGLLRRKPPMNFKHCWLLYFLLLSVFSIAFINTSRLEARVLTMHTKPWKRYFEQVMITLLRHSCLTPTAECQACVNRPNPHDPRSNHAKW